MTRFADAAHSMNPAAANRKVVVRAAPGGMAP
jgi:hypothetical protein